MNIATKYLGLSLRTPFIVGASPFCDDVHSALQLQDAGAAALVMRSLFEEQIDPHPAAPTTVPGGEIAFPEVADYQLSPTQYLQQLRHLKRTLTIPVIASLNGCHTGHWVEFGKQLEDAGAAAIELNFYRVVTDPGLAGDVIEEDLLRTVGELSSAVKIPVAVKLSPFHTSLSQLALALEFEGAAGLVLFNRFYQPDINVDEIEVQSQLRLSEPGELLLRLRWLAILSPQLCGSLAASGGIQNATGAAKSLLAGADAVQLVSILLKQGPKMIAVMVRDLQAWMALHGFDNLDSFRGRLNMRNCSDASAFERSNYVRTLQSWKI